MAGDPTPHVRFEYDPEFEGGDYSGTGTYVLVPLSEVEEHGAEAAFTRQTGYPEGCLVHHTLDELFDADGTRLTEDDLGRGGPRP